MSEPTEEGTGPGPAGDGTGVLANLPRERPQRASARRAAARKRVSAKATPAASEKPRAAAKPPRAGKRSTPKAKAAQKPAAKPRTSARSRRPAAPEHEPVPRQGYAGDADRATGPVAPPGGAEILATAAEALNELAKAGFSRGERLVRDLITRLPRS